MFEKLKNMFIDKDSGGLKIGSIVAAAGGAVLGGMFLAPIVAGLPVVGALAPIVGAALGGIGLLAGKEIVLPMITGNKGQQQPQPTTGFRSNDAPAAGYNAPGHAHSHGLPTPNVPNNGPGEQKQR